MVWGWRRPAKTPIFVFFKPKQVHWLQARSQATCELNSDEESGKKMTKEVLFPQFQQKEDGESLTRICSKFEGLNEISALI